MISFMWRERGLSCRAKMLQGGRYSDWNSKEQSQRDYSHHQCGNTPLETVNPRSATGKASSAATATTSSGTTAVVGMMPAETWSGLFLAIFKIGHDP